MLKLPDYIGPMAFGVKMGVVVPGTDLNQMVMDSLVKCYRDGLLDDGDTICITESVVARAQNNYVTLAEISRQISEKLSLGPGSKVGVVWPIASRNRFAQILRGIARTVPGGEVYIQLSFPYDEVGNRIILPELCDRLKDASGVIMDPDGEGEDYLHPITRVNYIQLYRNVVREEGAKPVIVLSNDPLEITRHPLDGVIVANIHSREVTRSVIAGKAGNCITLQDICNRGEAWSEWGVLGSNMSSGEKVKLAPRDGEQVVKWLQNKIASELGKKVEVLIYGDGAYRDPSSGIYELADPRPVFASTGGLSRFREGIKYKYLADCYHNDGKTPEEIEKLLQSKKDETYAFNCIESEGTTPRFLGDVLASLADLVSGSADAGTPVVIVRGI